MTESDAERQKRAVADLYSRVAASYDQVGPAVFAHFGERVIAIAGIGAGARVLDVGAGRGASLFPAAAAVGVTGQVVGIDIAEAMVEETSRAIEACGLTNATMLHMDAEELAFVDASFDYVLCSFAYFFFPHLERALAQFFRVLRPGGMLLLTAQGEPDERWRWYERMLNETFERHNLPWPLALGPGHRPLDELEHLLLEAGFRASRRVPAVVEAIYPDADAWWAAKWTHGQRRPLEAMPPEVLRAFVAEVNARLAPLWQTDGFHEVWRIVCMLAGRPTQS